MIGIDEVGRGSLAGPLLVCALRFTSKPPAGLNDSKKLTYKKREALDVLIRPCAHIGFGWVQASEIDTLGITKSMELACNRAVTDINYDGNEEIILDGSINYLPNLNCTTLVKADQTIAEVSAASIVAKVARDKLMAEMATQYSGYGFEIHAGYGTAMHIAAIKTRGYSAEHRRSYKIEGLT